MHIGLTERFRKAYSIKARELVLGIRLPELEGKIAQLEVKPRFGGKLYDVTIVHKEEEGQKKYIRVKEKKRLLPSTRVLTTSSQDIRIRTAMPSS